MKVIGDKTLINTIVINGDGIDQDVFINEKAIHKTENEIRKEAMEQMYEVMQYLCLTPDHGGCSASDNIEMFGSSIITPEIFNCHTAEQLYKKVSEYIKAKAFRVGDLVYEKKGHIPAVITSVDHTKGSAYIMACNGHCGFRYLEDLAKYEDQATVSTVFNLLRELEIRKDILERGQ